MNKNQIQYRLCSFVLQRNPIINIVRDDTSRTTRRLFCFIVLIFSFSHAFTQNSFVPDTIINNICFLRNSNASKEFYDNINNIELLDEDFEFLHEESPLFIFFNADKTEYLITFKHEGDIDNSFSEFEIGYVTEKIKKEVRNKYIETAYKDFQTENHICLGMTLEELEVIKGKNYIRKGNTITYFINDIVSDFLRKYNMPEYFLKCEFSKNRVCKIRFGFSYP